LFSLHGGRESIKEEEEEEEGEEDVPTTTWLDVCARARARACVCVCVETPWHSKAGSSFPGSSVFNAFPRLRMMSTAAERKEDV
jgi:hypothetical protein